mgnify:CR=1 FL=1
MSHDRPAGMDSTTMHMNKPQPDATKMSKVAGVACCKVEAGTGSKGKKTPKLPPAGD